MIHRLIVLTVTFLVALAPVTTAVAQDADSGYVVEAEDGFLAAINQARADQGLGALVANAELQSVARSWTEHLDSSQVLSHNPSYTQQYTGAWQRMGENVGYSTQVDGIPGTFAYLHQAFMNSAGHLANILGDYNQVGIGVLIDPAGKMWVTVNFLQGPIPPAEDEADDTPPPAPSRSHFTRGGGVTEA